MRTPDEVQRRSVDVQFLDGDIGEFRRQFGKHAVPQAIGVALRVGLCHQREMFPRAAARELERKPVYASHAGAREYGMSYSVLMGKLAEKNIALNRKTLADLAMNHPEAFKAVMEEVNL